MKVEIDEDSNQYRLVDGIEGTGSYVIGETVDFGEKAELFRDGKPDAWALIETDQCCDGLSHESNGDTHPLEFEFGCEFYDDGDDEDDDGDEEDAE